MSDHHSEQSHLDESIQSTLSEKSQKEWLEHIAGWLEYQKICGASEWRVDDMTSYTASLNNRPLTQFHRPNSVQEHRKSSMGQNQDPVSAKQTTESPSQRIESSSKGTELDFKKTNNKKTFQSTISSQERQELQSQKLGGKWSAVSHRIHKGAEKRDSFSYLQVSAGPEGMQQIRNFHSSQGCPNCSLGRGSLNAPVVLMEWHSEIMSTEAFVMLKNMRERVLNLPKEQLFWLPFPRGEDCGACSQIFRAQMGVLAPKAVLLMGAMPIRHLNFVSNPPEVGEQAFLSHKGSEIPLVRTENPMKILNIQDLAQRNKLKVDVLKHLRHFHSILADLRMVKRIR